MTQDNNVIELTDVTKVYRMGQFEVNALAGVSLTIQRGEMTAIMGPSGSGKSTIMNIIGCIDVPTSGRYVLDGEDVGTLNDDRLAWRQRGIEREIREEEGDEPPDGCELHADQRPARGGTHNASICGGDRRPASLELEHEPVRHDFGARVPLDQRSECPIDR